MNLFSLFALLAGFFLVIMAFLLEGGYLSSLWQLSAFLIVIGGTLCAVALQSTPTQFIRGIKMGFDVFRPKYFDFEAGIAEVLSWAQQARRNGLLSLEGLSKTYPDGLIRKSLQMLTDGADPQTIQGAANTEISLFEHQQKQAIKVWESAAGYAPTMGILGAVLGLIHVLENLSDPGKLGPGIAVAFVATVYGVAFANLLFLPIANKLKNDLNLEAMYKEMITEGIAAIANGENPRIIETRLQSFLAIER